MTAGQIDVYDHGERQNQILSNVTDVQEGWLVVSGRQSAVSAQWSVAGSGRPQLTTNILFVLLLLLVLVPILPLGGLGFVSRALPEWREHRWAVPPCPNLKKGGGLSSGRAAHARRIVDQKKIDCGACTCDILVSLHRSIIIYRGEGRTWVCAAHCLIAAGGPGRRRTTSWGGSSILDFRLRGEGLYPWRHSRRTWLSQEHLRGVPNPRNLRKRTQVAENMLAPQA